MHTLPKLQIIESANNIDLNEAAHNQMSSLIWLYTVCHIFFKFSDIALANIF